MERIYEFVVDNAYGEANQLKVVRHTQDVDDKWDDATVNQVRVRLIKEDKRFVYAFFPFTIVVMPRAFAEATLSFELHAASMFPCREAITDLTTIIAASDAKPRDSAIGRFRHVCCLVAKLVRCYVWKVVHKQAASKIWCVYESGVRLLWPEFTVAEHGQMLAAMTCFLGVPALVTKSRAKPRVPAIVMQFGVELVDIKTRLLKLIELANK